MLHSMDFSRTDLFCCCQLTGGWVTVVLLHRAFVELLLAPASKVLNSWFEVPF